MSNNCMNCGAMLMSGQTVCPVCGQPVAPAQSAGGWQQPQQPVASPVKPWPQTPYTPPPPAGGSGLKVVGAGLVAVMLLLAVAGGGFFVYMKNRDAAVKGRNDNRKDRAYNETVPDTTDTDAPPTSPTNPLTSNNSRPPISGGVLNGKAISLPKPTYPPVARAARASGTVTVKVTVDETGKVTDARAVSGHPLLQAAAVAAARNARFSPTMLDGKPVKITGVVSYTFAPE
jgi:TonB family protein